MAFHPSMLVPASCAVCEGLLVGGETCRLLLDQAGSAVYGHADCIDRLVAERLALGQSYLGNIRAP